MNAAIPRLSQNMGIIVKRMEAVERRCELLDEADKKVTMEQKDVWRGLEQVNAQV